MEDRKHTHYVSIYSKIHTSIKGGINLSDKSLEDGPSEVIKAFHCIFLVVSDGI